MNADTDLNDIETGMEVYDHDGKPLGYVRYVYPGHVQGKYSLANVGGSTSTADPHSASVGDSSLQDGEVDHESYFQVQPGVVGQEDVSNLYIPMHAVENINEGVRVTLKITEQQAVQQFTRRPDWLSPSSAR